MKKINLLLIIAAIVGLSCPEVFAKAKSTGFKNKGDLQKDIEESKTAMFVCPHPDDEVFIAGTIAFSEKDKDNIFYVLCVGSLDNVRKESIDVPSRIKAIRWLDKTYLKDYIFLDNIFTKIEPKMAQEIKKQVAYMIEERKPDIIITFSPAGYDGNHNRKMISKIVTDACLLLSYRPKVYYVINMDQELQFKAREYRKHPPTDIIDLNVDSKRLGKSVWEAKLEIWSHYSDSVPAIMGIMAHTERLEKNDRKEYFMRAR
jgi:LmbE family N-acetylglucosaminyl deacetylase